jgi:hypothetical protein
VRLRSGSPSTPLTASARRSGLPGTKRRPRLCGPERRSVLVISTGPARGVRHRHSDVRRCAGNTGGCSARSVIIDRLREEFRVRSWATSWKWVHLYWRDPRLSHAKKSRKSICRTWAHASANLNRERVYSAVLRIWRKSTDKCHRNSERKVIRFSVHARRAGFSYVFAESGLGTTRADQEPGNRRQNSNVFRGSPRCEWDERDSAPWTVPTVIPVPGTAMQPVKNLIAVSASSEIAPPASQSWRFDRTRWAPHWCAASSPRGAAEARDERPRARV